MSLIPTIVVTTPTPVTAPRTYGLAISSRSHGQSAAK
jgi:hypothetical protein